jgi:hypothetical protein
LGAALVVKNERCTAALLDCSVGHA